MAEVIRTGRHNFPRASTWGESIHALRPSMAVSKYVVRYSTFALVDEVRVSKSVASSTFLNRCYCLKFPIESLNQHLNLVPVSSNLQGTFYRSSQHEGVPSARDRGWRLLRKRPPAEKKAIPTVDFWFRSWVGSPRVKGLLCQGVLFTIVS